MLDVGTMRTSTHVAACAVEKVFQEREGRDKEILQPQKVEENKISCGCKVTERVTVGF